MNWLEVGPLSELDRQAGRTVVVGQCEVGLFHLSDGTIAALSNRCPHRGGSLSEGMVSGHYVFCPLHDWKIDLKTGNVMPPDSGNVDVFPVEVRDGVVFLGVDPIVRTVCRSGTHASDVPSAEVAE